MKRPRLTSITLWLLLILTNHASLTSCLQEKSSSGLDALDPEITSLRKGPLDVPDGFVPRYKLLETDYISNGNVTRVQLRITVPRRLSDEDIKNNIRSVIADHYTRENPDGVSVVVYNPGDNIHQAFTVAMGEYAPFGEWEKVAYGMPKSIFGIQFYFRKTETLSL